MPIATEEVYVDENGKRTVAFSIMVDTDEGPRPETSMEALAKLKPVFAMGGSVTAGNSSPTNDGAAFAVVMSEKMIKQLNLKPIAGWSVML